MPSKICPQCNAEYELNQSFCPIDGASLRLPANKDGDLVGQVFSGRYKLIRKLGGGGMGNVYLAEHVRLKSMSAVKVIRPVLNDDADAAARFNREAQNASLINHPNVASVFDFGEADGLMFLAMEYVDGEPLSNLIKRGPMSPDSARRIVTQIGEALTAAHRLGIVHRDLKPDNIMVGKGTDDNELVKLVDFGISKITANTDQKVTATGAIIGTPAYMSPEQASSDKGVDARSDIYSFGVLTFQMLTASLPFTGETAQEQIVSRLMYPASTLSTARPDIPWAPAIEASLAKAMATDPNLRFSSAQEFARDFDTAVRSGAVRQSKTVQMDSAELAKEVAASAAAAKIPATILDKSPEVIPATRVVKKGPNYAVLGGVGVVAAAAIGFVVMTQMNKKVSPTDSVTPSPVAAAETTKVDQSGNTTGQKTAGAQAESTTKSIPESTPSRGTVPLNQRIATNSADTKAKGPDTTKTAPATQVAANQTPVQNAPTQAAPVQSPATAPTTSSPAAQPPANQPKTAPPPVDLGPEIRQIRDMVATPDKDDAEYKAAYDKSMALLPKSVTASDSAQILYYQAKAVVFLGDQPRACRTLARAVDIAKGTSLAGSISRTSQTLGCP